MAGDAWERAAALLPRFHEIAPNADADDGALCV